jgi:ADP-ribosylglycohydrolase
VAAARPDDPWFACRIAASLGGDCDTVAAMTGAVCGAGTGAGAFPEGARKTVAAVNHLELEVLAERLLDVRRQTRGLPAPSGGLPGPGQGDRAEG